MDSSWATRTPKRESGIASAPRFAMGADERGGNVSPPIYESGVWIASGVAAFPSSNVFCGIFVFYFYLFSLVKLGSGMWAALHKIT